MTIRIGRCLLIAVICALCSSGIYAITGIDTIFLWCIIAFVACLQFKGIDLIN